VRSLLRGGHEALVHPFAEIGAEPFARQLSAQPSPFALFVDQSACGGELNTDTGIALIVDNLLVVLPSRMIPSEDLAQLADLFPAELAAVDQIEQFALLVGDRGLFV
jgi:hypothetical protein